MHVANGRTSSFPATKAQALDPSFDIGIAILIEAVVIYQRLITYNLYSPEPARIQIMTISRDIIHDKV